MSDALVKAKAYNIMFFGMNAGPKQIKSNDPKTYD